FQDKYGLVKDAAKMSVVVIETEHAGDAKPVSNLLDGNLSTFVHSSYGTDKDQVTNHYIQVELSEAQQYIMFYMAKRNSDNNNRPKTIKVYVSNDGTNFGTEPVATLENLHFLGNPYYSPSIDLGAAYKYVRFVVSETNTGTKYFTASEFYVLPINDETTVLSVQNDVTTINDVVLNLQNALLAKAELYAPMNEANALLTAHASNHAAVPALGQYTTTAYNNLLNVVNSKPTLAQLNEALDAFDKGQNRPVFIFTSANDGAYCNNGAIYDEGSSWRWMTKNYYDKRMFFTVKDLTAAELTSGTAYNMYNYATGRSMFYDGTVTPEAVSGLDGVFNLKVNTGNGNLHCQAAGQSLVTWHPCVPLEAGGYDRMASAWRYEYVGNSYDFDQITDFPVSANELMGIQLNCTAANFGGGLGQYSGVKYSEVEAAKETVEALQEKENAERYSITETEARNAIEAVNSSLAGATLNQPATNKFYRFKNLSSKKYLTSTLTDNKMTMGEAGNTRESVFYLTEDNKLISYENGLFSQNFTSGNYAFEAVGSEGHAVVFAQGNPVNAATSCYHLSCGVRSLYGKNATLDAGGNIAVNNNDNGYDWAIEEVQWLPVAVSSTAKYGTLYAPVDLALRDNLEAYTATVDGDKLQLQAVTDKIPAGTAVILKDNGADRDKGTNCIYLEVTSDAKAVSGNDLVGTYKAIAKPAQDIYTLQNPSEGIGFYKYVGANLGGFKAYLAPSTPLANGLSFDFGAATGLDNVATELPADAPAYDLTGRRVNKNTKGIIIVGNKKVIHL
ncbi:MAG: discoidin domain-containing protein, partial [Bacteroidales bacterium]|nr:discoidin domain-containing protein [Bacteroidales bacterium]